MTSSVNTAHFKIHSLIYVLLACLLLPAQAYCANSFIEYSRMSQSDTLRNVNTLGFYTIFKRETDHQYYAGIDLALFEPETATDNHMATRVTMGISGVSTVAPYAEIGVGLFDLLVRGNDSAQTCNSEQRSCNPDFYFRAGLRMNMTNHLAIGVFYEGVSFGDFEDELVGSHGYSGVNIGVRY